MFFNDTAPTEIYTLSLHDALPICTSASRNRPPRSLPGNRTASTPPTTHTIWKRVSNRAKARPRAASGASRSEEHTSELQSQSNLVCRLLLEKKKKSLESQHIPDNA